MGKERGGRVPPDVLESLRTNPALASLSDEALAKIADVVAAETVDQVSTALGKVALFEGLSEEDLEQIQEIADPRICEAGDMLFREDDPGDCFYVLVRGAVELQKGSGSGARRLTVLKAGQAFGEMALLNDSPRSATARVIEPSYLITISRDRFERVLGGDTLALRLLRGLSKALWSASVRLTAKEAKAESPKESLAEYNRMVRSRLLPRAGPRVSGYDVAASTLVNEQGEGSAVWDWFPLRDGRPVMAVLKSDHAGLSAAQQLATARLLLRDGTAEPVENLGALLTRVNRGLRAGWVEGLSGPVTCGLLSLGDGEIELAGAGAVTGAIVRSDGTSDDLVSGAPSLGVSSEQSYEATTIPLDEGDHVILFSDGPSDSVDVARRVLLAGGFSEARETLTKLLGRIKAADAGVEGLFDVTAALVTCTEPPSHSVKSTADAIARAAAAYEAGNEGEGRR